jgi:hypothetical protein
MPIDVPYTTPNRANAGLPATAQYAGEIVYDSTAKMCMVALGNPAAPMWGQFTYGMDVDGAE